MTILFFKKLFTIKVKNWLEVKKRKEKETSRSLRVWWKSDNFLPIVVAVVKREDMEGVDWTND